MELPGAAPLDEAVVLGSNLDGEVIGYRCENNGLVGEFYPSSAYSAAEFLAEFSAKYSSSPRVIALVAEFETTEQAKKNSNRLPTRRGSYDPPDIDTSSLDSALEKATDNGPVEAGPEGEGAKTGSELDALIDRGAAEPLLQRHRMDAEVFRDLLDRHSGLTAPRNAHDVVTELARVGLWHSNILPGPPSRASQIRWHLTVQQTLPQHPGDDPAMSNELEPVICLTFSVAVSSS